MHARYLFFTNYISNSRPDDEPTVDSAAFRILDLSVRINIPSVHIYIFINRIYRIPYTQRGKRSGRTAAARQVRGKNYIALAATAPGV